MTTEVLTVQGDWYLDRLAGFLVENGISGAPVLGEDGEVIGVVSLNDIVRHRAEGTQEAPDEPSLFFQEPLETRLSKEDLRTLQVREVENVTTQQIMTKVVFSVEEDTPVSEIAGVMVQGRVHRILVMNGPKIAGIISSLNLLELLMDE